MASHTRTTTTPAEAAMIVAICFGWAIYSSVWAVLAGFPTGGQGASATFSDASLISIVVVELIVGGAALLLLHARRYAVATLVPTPTLKESLLGVGLYLAASVAGGVLASPFTVRVDDEPIAQMMSQASLSLPVLLLMAMVNGTFEEVFVLGFLQRGLMERGPSVAVGVALLVRLLYHLYQGPMGAVWVTGFGLVFGLFYLRTGRLWPAVFAHMLGDLVPFVGSFS